MDDGSTDDTQNVIRHYNDPRLVYECANNSGGPARPRNRGIALARGEWICFLDADDWWTDDKLRFCFDMIETKVDFICHNMKIVRVGGHFWKKKEPRRQKTEGTNTA